MSDATKRLVEAAREILATPGALTEPYGPRAVALRNALAGVERASLGTPWQCSGCREVFFGRHRETCPGCGRVGYWSGSIEPRALSDAQARALDALDAERPAVEWRCVGEGLHEARAGEWTLRARDEPTGAPWLALAAAS